MRETSSLTSFQVAKRPAEGAFGAPARAVEVAGNLSTDCAHRLLFIKMLDYFWTVLLGYTFAMFAFPLFTFFQVRGRPLPSPLSDCPDYYFYTSG